MASRELFVDTSAWYPLVVARHPEHRALSAVLHKRVAHGERVVTTNLVLAESYTLLAARGFRAAAVRFITTVRQSPNLVVSATPAIEERAIHEWLEPFDDQDFSYVDAVSFAVMKERRIRSALTLDHHFTTAGFEMAAAAK